MRCLKRGRLLCVHKGHSQYSGFQTAACLDLIYYCSHVVNINAIRGTQQHGCHTEQDKSLSDAMSYPQILLESNCKATSCVLPKTFQPFSILKHKPLN